MGQKMAENREAEHVSTSESEQSDFIEPEIGHKDTDEPFINVDYEALEEYDIQPSGVIHELVRQSSQDDGKNLSSNDEISGGEEGRSESEQVRFIAFMACVITVSMIYEFYCFDFFLKVLCIQASQVHLDIILVCKVEGT